MAKYRIFYEFLEKPNPFKNLEKEMPWGEGAIEGDLAYIPATDDEWKNLSGEVAKSMDYAAVNVTRILPLEGNFKVTDNNDIIEGELVADES